MTKSEQIAYDAQGKCKVVFYKKLHKNFSVTYLNNGEFDCNFLNFRGTFSKPVDITRCYKTIEEVIDWFGYMMNEKFIQ